MRKIALIFSLVSSFSVASFAQHKGQINASLLPKGQAHYMPEYTLDKTVDEQAWTATKPGLHVSFGSTDKLYFRTEVPVQQPSLLWQTTGWKGERLNAQVLLWATDTLEQVRFKVSDLVSADGETIGSGQVKLNMVRYVLSDYPYGARDVVCGKAPYENGFLMPDRFETFERFNLPGKTVRPIWVSLDVPPYTAPGSYTGTITVNTSEHTATLQVKINVQDQLLPAPCDWKYRLDLWQNPWAVATYNHLEPWSTEHKVLLKQHMQLYADAGGKYITTYGVHSPWSDNSYRLEGGMIDWVKEKDGSWKFDYSIFDEYVEMSMEMGIDEAITVYTPVPWGNRFRYMDAATGNYVYETWAPETENYKKIWHIFLTDFKKHLERKGWFGKTYLGINENELQQTLAAIKVIKDHSSSWRITYAGNWHKELDTLLDDYSYLYGEEPTQKEQDQRNARGASTTVYVCCNPPYPNNFVFSPPIEGRWISWYAASRGYDGFLRWAYDAWPEDPMRDPRHGGWAAGDCFMIYPGGNSCIRFEKMREGIVDFEKMRILKNKVSASGDKEAKALWQALEQHLKVFAAERAFKEEKITADVDKGRSLIETLSNKLAR